MKSIWLLTMGLVSFNALALAPDSGTPLTQNALQRALIEPAMVQQAIEIADQTDRNAGLEPPAGESPIVVLKGSSNVIITAPHGTKPKRGADLRFADGGGTAALAVMLNKLSCATVIYTRYQQSDDPNHSENSAFKDALNALINERKPVLLLDIHASHDFRPYDLDVGTMDGQSVAGSQQMLSDLITALRGEGMGNFSSNYFSAAKNATLTKLAKEKGVPAIQLEFSSTWMRPAENGLMAHRFAQVLQGMVRYVRSVSDSPDGVCKPQA